MATQAWWLDVWREADQDPLRARAVRAVGDALPNSALWQMLQWELGPVGAGAAERSELHGRLALAVLLDLTTRYAPEATAPLVRSLIRRHTAMPDFELVGTFARVIDAALQAWGRLLTADPSRSALAALGDIVPFDATAEGSGPAVRRRQAELILAYRNAVKNPNEVRLGIGVVATWAADDALRARLGRVGGRFEPGAVFIDVVALAALSALRVRRQLAARGIAIPPPDPRVMDTPAAVVNLAVRARADSAPPPTTRPIEPTVPRPVAAQDRPSTFPAAAPTPLHTEAWWAAARLWFGDKRKRLESLLEVATRLERSRLWPLLIPEVRRLPVDHSLRLPEVGRYALAVLLDEYLRAVPPRYGELLELLVIDPDELIDIHETGRLWKCLDPMFSSWARQLDPKLDPKDTGLVTRTLSRRGDILPWDDHVKGRPEARERKADKTIDAVYVDGDKDVERARLAAYWAATMARNEWVHETPRTLSGRVRPMELLNDVIALAALASLRFRITLAEDAKTQVSVPSIANALLVSMIARQAAEDGVEG